MASSRRGQLLAVARHGAGQALLQADAGAPAPQGRRHRRQVGTAGLLVAALQPFHRLEGQLGTQQPPSVAIFTKPGCPFCAKAKALLKEKGLSYEEIVLGRDASTVAVRAISGRTTVPQVYIGGRHIGGSDDLEAYFKG